MGGRFGGGLLVMFVAITVGYVVLQRIAISYVRRDEELKGTGRRPSRRHLVLALVFFLSPMAIVPITFLELGKLMIDNNLIPSIVEHPSFDPAANYDPDHVTKRHPTENRDFYPHEVDPNHPPGEPVNLFLGPYGAATWWDLTFKEADVAMFGGTYPSIWVRQFHAPWLSAVMQYSYAFYYFAPGLACVPLLWPRRRRRRRGVVEGGDVSEDVVPHRGGIRLDEFRVATATIGTCILLTYVLYFFFPSTGPRFEGGVGAWMPAEPGWLGAEALFLLIDAAETFRWDAFPSGHVAVSVTSMLVALKYRPKIGMFMVLPTMALCACTLYNGYHYVADILGGIACAVVTLMVVPRFVGWWHRA